MMKHCPRVMSDRFFIKVRWSQVVGYKLDLKHPKKFNEKLQWLKLYDHKPEYTIMVDKYRAKQWLADKIGEQYVVPTLSIYKSVDEIDLNKLPDQFVLKCNHDSGSVIICRDKQSFDFENAKQKLNKALHSNYYWRCREWPYKHVKPVILAEPFIYNSQTDNISVGGMPQVLPSDYKFYCFEGEPKLFYITTDKGMDVPIREDFFDLQGNHLDIQDSNYLNNPMYIPNIPNNLQEMQSICRMISKNINHLRVDFYECNGRIYVGEMTFYEAAGYCNFEPSKWNIILGDWIKLPIDSH